MRSIWQRPHVVPMVIEVRDIVEVDCMKNWLANCVTQLMIFFWVIFELVLYTVGVGTFHIIVVGHTPL